LATFPPTRPYFGIDKQPRGFGVLLFVASLLPALLIVPAMLSDLFYGSRWLGADPTKEGEHMLGEWVLRFLFAALAVTPLRHLTGWNWLAKHRRTLGLFAFAYVCLHLLTWTFLDVQILVSEYVGWADVWEDIAKRPYLTIGMLGFVLMVPLAWTSTKAAIRRMGKRWTRLHRLAYVIPVLGVIHYLMAVKKDIEEPLMYGAVLAGLLLWRAWIARQRSAAAATA
jgi:sulfoxide reductase heme-binding subunit YedZ